MRNPTDHPIHSLLSERWSPYQFDPEKSVSKEDLNSLFEAARWAQSAYNAQPWRYIVGSKDRSPEVWQQVHDVLVDGNKGWTAHAPVLVLGLIAPIFEHNGAANPTALHDLGAASASLTVEATHRGLVVHQMSGIKPDAARQVFGLPGDLTPATALAIGHALEGGAGDLAQRDARPRERKPLSDLIIRGEL